MLRLPCRAGDRKAEQDTVRTRDKSATEGGSAWGGRPCAPKRGNGEKEASIKTDPNEPPKLGRYNRNVFGFTLRGSRMFGLTICPANQATFPIKRHTEIGLTARPGPLFRRPMRGFLKRDLKTG